MEEKSLPTRVDEIRQVFTYVERFKGALFVITIDSGVARHPFFPSLVDDIASLHRMGIRIAIVAGARRRIDEILAAQGIESRRVGQVRISSPGEMPSIKIAAFDAATQIMTRLSASNCSAIIGNWVRARAIGVVEGVDYEGTGRVEKVRGDLIGHVLSEGLVPIFPCIGWSAAGEPYNLSSDELAGLLGTSLQADKVFYITDSAGIEEGGYLIPEEVERDQDGRISGLRLDQARAMLELNRDRCDTEWYAILTHAYEACRGGVRRVHIVDGRSEGVLLKEVFTNLGSGTMIYANEYESIRPMRLEDVSDVLRIMRPFIENGALVNRDRAMLEESLEQFVVYEIDGTVHGCGALVDEGGGVAEIAGITVDESFSREGIGKRIVRYLIDLAKQRQYIRLFLLTTYGSDWFVQLGFRQATVDVLPRRRRTAYDRGRNSRVMIYDLEG